jgi:hypothetical protein
MLDLVSDAYRRTYAARSGQSEGDVAAMMAAETWFTAAEAMARGFATEVTAPAEIFASADRLSGFSCVPAALAARALTHPLPLGAVTPPALPVMPAMPAIKENATVADETPQAAGNPPPVSMPTLPVPMPVPARQSDIEALAQRGDLGAEFVLAQLRNGATIE